MAIPANLSEVPNATPYIQYVAVNAQTVYPYPFPITQDSDLVVVINGVTQATDSTYTLTGQGNDTGGNCVLNTGSMAGDIITLYRDIPIERLTQISQNSGFSSTAFNAEFNNLYLIAQQLETQISQCLQVPNTNNPAPTTVLTPALYANKYLAFDNFGNPTPAVLTTSGSLTGSIVAALINIITTVPIIASLFTSASETANSVVPVDFSWPVGHVFRYMTAVQQADVIARTQLHDVTSCVQAACNVFNGTGGTVVFPYGTYLISSAITVAGSSTKLLGPSRSVTSYGTGAIISSPNNIEFFTVTGSWVKFEDLGMYCSNNAHTHRHVNMTTGNFMTLENCYLQGVNSGGSATGSGVTFGSGGDAGNIVRCVLDNCGVDVNTSDVHLVDSWLWANTRQWAVKVNGGSNCKILGCDILPPQTNVSGLKAGIYVTNAALQCQVLGCYFDGNATLNTGPGLLADAGSIGLIVADCIGNLLTDWCIILDSLICPNVHHNTFYNGNRGRTTINGTVPGDILLRQTGAQPMAQPNVSDNRHIYTITPGGTAGPAIRVLTGTAQNGMMIERNAIFSNGAGGGYADQEITIDDGLFASSIAGSLSRNIGSRKMSCGSASAAFSNGATSVTINLPFNLYYQARIDQVRVNFTTTPVAYQVQVLNALQIFVGFPAAGGNGTCYVNVDLA